ncbi:MAG: metallophosphoesterase [Candidatus Dormibacteria bacterium]|jgi:calcineurin-like phosphoesterase family protein
MIKGLPETDPDELRAVLDTLLVISDTHWFHTRLAQELAPGVRPPNDHDLMLERWFATVGVDDVVLHLGDVIAGIDPATYNERLQELPGHIYLLPGNHDRQSSKLEQFVRRGWKLVPRFEAAYGGWRLRFTHEPISVDLMKLAPDVINVHGHIHHNPAPSPRHVNVSVEQIQYAPVRLAPLLNTRIAELGIPLAPTDRQRRSDAKFWSRR